jgi:hypothetical protein
MVFRGSVHTERSYRVNGNDSVPDVRNAVTAQLCDLIEKRAPALEFLKYPVKYKSLFREPCP